jgi:CRISPR-associated endonuclease Cas1
LGVAKGCITVKDRQGKVRRYSLSENAIDEIRVASGNTLSSSALCSLAFWGTDVLVLTRSGNPICVVKNLLDSDSHVETRIKQYQSLENGKGLTVAKEIVLAKIRGYNEVLRKYGLRRLDYCALSQSIRELEGDLSRVRSKLMSIEGRYSRQYFSQVLGLFKHSLRPEQRKTYKAYDLANNVLSLSYATLFWKLQLAVYRSKLESHLGFLHSVQWSMPSLILDLQDVFRYVCDDFTIGFSRKIGAKDFALIADDYVGKKCKREFLKPSKRREFLDSFDRYFDSSVNIPRVRRGKKQQLNTLLNEEVMLLAEFLRNEKSSWHPRIVTLS